VQCKNQTQDFLFGIWKQFGRISLDQGLKSEGVLSYAAKVKLPNFRCILTATSDDSSRKHFAGFYQYELKKRTSDN
jgi:hypothetical protein